MATDMEKPLPDRDDPDTAAFWEGTDRGELRIKHCAACGKLQWPPRLGCAACGSDQLGWTPVAPFGTIYSWTVIHRSLTPGFQPPYAVVLVELSAAPGVRLIGNLVNAPPESITAGMAVEAVFQATADATVKLVYWQPAAVSSNGFQRLHAGAGSNHQIEPPNRST